MVVLIVVSAMVVALFICAAWFSMQRGTYVLKSGVVRACSPHSNHYMGEGALFAASVASHEVEVDVEGVVHRCWTNQMWSVGQQVSVSGVQNTHWRALKIEH